MVTSTYPRRNEGFYMYDQFVQKIMSVWDNESIVEKTIEIIYESLDYIHSTFPSFGAEDFRSKPRFFIKISENANAERIITFTKTKKITYEETSGSAFIDREEANWDGDYRITTQRTIEGSRAVIERNVKEFFQDLQKNGGACVCV